MKKLFLLVGVLCVTGCDSNVDITKYPENIQTCYNSVFYHSDNCNKSKTIIKYCQCFNAKSDAITKKTNQTWGTISQARAQNMLMYNALEREAHESFNKAADECAKKTGYVRVANCKK